MENQDDPLSTRTEKIISTRLKHIIALAQDFKRKPGNTALAQERLKYHTVPGERFKEPNDLNLNQWRTVPSIPFLKIEK